jgi:hypothetical protein
VASDLVGAREPKARLGTYETRTRPSSHPARSEIAVNLMDRLPPVPRLATLIPILALAASALAPTQVAAHHSAAAFDVTREVTIEGIVTKLDWQNPHAYFTVETVGPDGERLLQPFEADPVTVLVGHGLKKEALAPGTRVVVRAFPSRRGPGRLAMGLDVVTPDGATHPLDQIRGRSSAPPVSGVAEGLAGSWFPEDKGLKNIESHISALQLTEAGAAALREELADGAFAAMGHCEPIPPPLLTLVGQQRSIEVSDTTVVIRFDEEGQDIVQVVHLDQKTHPADVAPTVMGHSIGRWEGQTLVIDTVGFTPHHWGVTILVPSGPRKHLVERLTLAEDRRSLVYEYTLEDPDYLTVPDTYGIRWDYRPDLERSGVTCDPETARRYLREE